MFVSPDKMPSDSRIWIYQANRKLSAEEESKITSLANEFIEGWTAHNQTLHASFEIRYGIFLIVMIDPTYTQASGCSIDKSVHFIQKLENDFAISLLDRQTIAIRESDVIQLVKRKDFERMIDKEIFPETIVFNNLVQTKQELETKWEVPIRESWHGAIR